MVNLCDKKDSRLDSMTTNCIFTNSYIVLEMIPPVAKENRQEIRRHAVPMKKLTAMHRKKS